MKIQKALLVLACMSLLTACGFDDDSSSSAYSAPSYSEESEPEESSSQIVYKELTLAQIGAARKDGSINNMLYEYYKVKGKITRLSDSYVYIQEGKYGIRASNSLFMFSDYKEGDSVELKGTLSAFKSRADYSFVPESASKISTPIEIEEVTGITKFDDLIQYAGAKVKFDVKVAKLCEETSKRWQKVLFTGKIGSDSQEFYMFAYGDSSIEERPTYNVGDEYTFEGFYGAGSGIRVETLEDNFTAVVFDSLSYLTKK